jgi:beta-lactam-binding protein with PASTA domain
VLAQQPAAGKRVAPGSTLVVTVAVGRRRPGPARLPAPPARVQARTSSAPATPAPATPAPATPAPATPAPGCGAQGTGWGAGWGSYRCR